MTDNNIKIIFTSNENIKSNGIFFIIFGILFSMLGIVFALNDVLIGSIFVALGIVFIVSGILRLSKKFAYPSISNK